MTVASGFRIGLRIAAAVLAVLALAGLAGWAWAVRWRPDPAAFPIQGVDVSAAQGKIDWFVAKGAGVDFAYVRATSGTARDSAFPEYWADAFRAGLRRGALHRYSLCRPAIAQADAFVTTVPRDADLLPAAVELDFAPDCAARPARDALLGDLRVLLAAIETHTGKPTLVKVSRAFENQYRIADAIPRGLWSAQPFFAPGYFPRPWRMWQASPFRRVAGIERPANWDVVAP